MVSRSRSGLAAGRHAWHPTSKITVPAACPIGGHGRAFRRTPTEAIKPLSCTFVLLRTSADPLEPDFPAVRREDEVKDGRIDGAKHLPLHSLVDRMHEVPHGKVWVHCASGFRASIAASILDRAGHEVVHIDDEYANAEKAGLRIIQP